MPKQRLIALLIASCVILWFLVSLYRLKTNPEGKYLMDRLAAGGFAYYEIKDGKFFLVVLEGYALSDKERERELLGTYSEQDDKWLATTTVGNEKSQFKPGVLSVTLLDANGKLESEHPRMFSIGGKVIRVYSTPY